MIYRSYHSQFLECLWIGAAVTSLLLAVGKFLIGHSGNSVRARLWRRRSLVILLLWIYYSAQILLFGAEFTQVYAKKYGSWSASSEKAAPLTRKTEVEQKILLAPSSPSEKALVEQNRPLGYGSTYKSYGAVLLGIFIAGLMIGARHSSKH